MSRLNHAEMLAKREHTIINVLIKSWMKTLCGRVWWWCRGACLKRAQVGRIIHTVKDIMFQAGCSVNHLAIHSKACMPVSPSKVKSMFTPNICSIIMYMTATVKSRLAGGWLTCL